MTKATNTKKKRILKDITFESDNSHIALVGPAVGGPANGQDFALIMKALNYSKETVEKMQQVRVTLELPDFLRKFFGMYYEDAEVLARVLGYEPPAQDDTYDENLYQRYLDDKVAAIEIMKQFKDKNETEILSSIKENDYLNILKVQEEFEKGLNVIKEIVKESKADDKSEKDTSIVKEVGKSTEVSTSKTTQELENSMTEKVEMVEKSVYVTLEKALEEAKTELQKAKETIAQFEQKEKEMVRKARMEKLTTAVKNKDKAEVLFKAVGLVESEEEFDVVVKSLAEMTAAIDKSDLMEEKGASAESQEPKKDESLVQKAINAKYSKKQ